MSLDTAPLLTRMRRFAAKVETTTGTPITLSNTDATTPVFSDPAQPIINYEAEMIDRPNNGSLSPMKKRVGARQGKATFETEIYGAGASGVPSWTKFLLACGMANNAGVFTPVTGAITTLTMSSFLGAGAITKTIAGAMGTAVWTLNRGSPARAAWTFSGKYIAPSTTTIATPTYDAVDAPLVAEATLLIGGVKYIMPQVVFDFGNTVIMRQDINDHTGFRAAYITARAPTVKISPEAVGLTSQDWYAAFVAGTTFSLAVTLGTDANNIIQLAIPNMQLNTAPNEGDRDGEATNELEFLCTEATAGGNDEYSITFPPGS